MFNKKNVNLALDGVGPQIAIDIRLRLSAEDGKPRNIVLLQFRKKEIPVYGGPEETCL